ncbi:leucine-rich repeat-containing protein 43-like isoform X1 [Acanthopagrus latus]|uniref:leucine-rich repeat-containing protein 43-like isoform X1 n=1 Tax=Acanthopagrus latus TaxID=8177 RepID=UPI00187CF13E|nr:leucine-rich repeat-containing protein 43-like isoform X1 [Acanthopagrus latus]
MLAGMSSKTLSAEIEKQIRRLCLNDFPCGNGSWRKEKDGTEAAETEDTDALLDLLSCPHSPWTYDESWSPQAPALRQLAVLAPERLHAAFIYNYFTTLRIVDKDVSVIDSGLLKFSKLEELVLSANKISEIPVENLPRTLKVLELRANRLSDLNRLTSQPPPHLRYLSLGSSSLGSHEDISNLTGRHWPQLVCLDLSDCEFQDQQVLMNALRTLPHLRTLVLEGNPFTLASCYPGFTLDSLPQLSYLDGSWISPEERQCFRGLAKMSDLIVDQASVSVRVGRMRGIPDPMMRAGNSTPDFPVVTYRYFITYEFLSHQTPVNLKFDSEPECEAAATAHVKEGCSSDADLPSSKTCEKETSKTDTRDQKEYTEGSCHDTAHVSRHSTSKLSWSECMDFSDTRTYNISDLRGLKRFLNQGFYLRIEEEKVLAWPAVSEDVKSSQTAKEKKGRKESAIKSGSTKDKSKDKKKKSVPELVQDTPVRRLLGSVHVPLQSLVKGGEKVDVLCGLGSLRVESEVEATQTLDKDLRKKIKEDKKKEDKRSKCRGGSRTGQRNTTASEVGKEDGRKKSETDVLTGNSVELRVELEKWQSASEARQLLLPHQSS